MTRELICARCTAAYSTKASSPKYCPPYRPVVAKEQGDAPRLALRALNPRPPIRNPRMMPYHQCGTEFFAIGLRAMFCASCRRQRKQKQVNLRRQLHPERRSASYAVTAHLRPETLDQLRALAVRRGISASRLAAEAVDALLAAAGHDQQEAKTPSPVRPCRPDTPSHQRRCGLTRTTDATTGARAAPETGNHRRRE